MSGLNLKFENSLSEFELSPNDEVAVFGELPIGRAVELRQHFNVVEGDAKDFESVMNMINSHAPEVIILGAGLGKCFCLSLIEAISSSQYFHQTTVIIAFDIDEGYLLKCLSLGVSDQISTDASIEEVTARVKVAIQKASYVKQINNYHPVSKLPNITFSKYLVNSLIYRNRQSVVFAICISIDVVQSLGKRQEFSDGSLYRVIEDRIRKSLDLDNGFSENRKIQYFICHASQFEFVVFTYDLDGRRAIFGLCESLSSWMENPAKISGQEIIFCCRVGVSNTGDDCKDFEGLVSRARYAVRSIDEKKIPRIKIYDVQLEHSVNRQKRFDVLLSRAADNGEVSLLYQPKYEFSKGGVGACEALARWKSDELGGIPPDLFITRAEEVGLINKLGEWIIYQALYQFKLNRDTYGLEIPTSINISPEQLRSRDICEKIDKYVTSFQIPPSSITFEVTETILVKEDEMMDRIRRLKSRGFKMSIDDFGTGYSSFEYLKDCPFDEVKIDKSFITDIESNLRSLSLLEGMVGIATAMGLYVTVEGVETEGQLKIIEDLGCAFAQGYYIGKPMGPAELFYKLNSRQRISLDS